MVVNHCVCHNITFAQLLHMHKKEGLSQDQLARETGCGTGCGMCKPYITLALLTGQTDLPPMSPGVLEAKIQHAQAHHM